MRFSGYSLFRLGITIGYLLIVGAPTSVTALGVGFFDDFSDMDAEDDSPVTWVATGSGTIDASSGDLVSTSIGDGTGGAFASGTQDQSYLDVSVHTQVRLLTGELSSGIGRAVAVAVRGGPSQNAIGAGISPDGGIGIGTGPPGRFVLAEAMTALDVTSTDIHLRFDALGDTFSLTVWEDGTPEPLVPQVTVTSTSFPSAGAVSVSDQFDFASSAVFRFVEVTVIPEPSTVLLVAFGLVALGAKRRHQG